jgi:phosphohistidine phosphatase SixA
MRFIFVRHGHYDGKGKTSAEKKVTPLNPRGREAARAAGEFLREHGIRPDVVFTTETARTKETAQIILGVLGLESLRAVPKSGGFAKGRADLDKKLEEWLKGPTPRAQTVLFVGHDTSQSYCLSELRSTPTIPPNNRSCVLVYRQQDGGWACEASFVGLPDAPRD